MSLRTENVSLVLGDGEQQVKALDEVTFSADSGELVVVLGPSGAGKSSLLAVCGGLRTPTSGKVYIDGTEITALKRSQLTEIRRDYIGFVFQQSNLVPALTALDQLLLLVDLKGKKIRTADRERARSLLDEVGMSEKADRRPNQLSGGERQRVGIARDIHDGPEAAACGRTDIDARSATRRSDRRTAGPGLSRTQCRDCHGDPWTGPR